MDAPKHEYPVRVIGPRSGWLDLDLRELWAARDLVALFVRRNVLAQYKQTALGPLWFVLQPLLTTLVFTVVFGRVARLPTDGLPQALFYLCGVVAWRFFADCLTTVSSCLRANAALLGKVYFPRLAVPLAVVLTGAVTFVVQFAIFLCVLGYFLWAGAPAAPGPWALLTPALVLLMAALGLGLGLLVAALTVRYRDLGFVVAFGVQLLLFASPVIYPLSLVPEGWQALALANPMAAILEALRFGLLGQGLAPGLPLGVAAAVSLGVLLLGLAAFSRVEKNFMDTV
ncbi:ABC transporter permease [Desulfocurvus vexinensis]|uniref:ABC transporter permease n=1 Tax=Desulfocurvus vexinensis TaxID=399548 RepID=UPI0004917993|nr:ABC transporter permease [Desulfocurvus vexinensis]